MNIYEHVKRMKIKIKIKIKINVRYRITEAVVESTRPSTSKMLAKSTATCLVSSNHTPSNVNSIISLIVHPSANHSLSKELENLELKNE